VGWYKPAVTGMRRSARSAADRVAYQIFPGVLHLRAVLMPIRVRRETR
jgi:hypothetical protein